MRKLLLASTIMACSLPTIVSAEKANTFYLSPGATYYDYDSDLGLDDDTNMSFGFGYNFNPIWALEGFYMEPDSDTNGSDIDIRHYRIDGLAHFTDSETFAPYFAFGYGRIETSDNNIQAFENGTNDDTSQLNAGLGFKWYFLEDVAFRLDVRAVNHVQEGDFDVLYTGGLTFRFDGFSDEPEVPVVAPVVVPAADSDGDGIADDQDNCPNTPAGVVVNDQGCPVDADGDGVLNEVDQCPDTAAGARVDEVGCNLQLEETVRMTLKLVFPSNSAQLQAQHRPEIRRVADFLREYPDTEVTLIGYTDSQGSESYNQQLSQRRAESVANYLRTEYSIPASRLNSEGRGESNPVADNSTAEGRAANRRVVAEIEATIQVDANK